MGARIKYISSLFKELFDYLRYSKNRKNTEPTAFENAFVNLVNLKEPVKVNISKAEDNVAILTFNLNDIIKSIKINSIGIERKILQDHDSPIIEGFKIAKKKVISRKDFEPDLEELFDAKGKNITAEDMKKETDAQYDDYIKESEINDNQYLTFDGEKIIDQDNNTLKIQFSGNIRNKGTISIYSTSRSGMLGACHVTEVIYE